MSQKVYNLKELKQKTLILTQTDPRIDTMFLTWINNGMNADIIFSPKPKILRAIRRIWTDGFLPGDEFWYGDWKNDLEKYDTVILHASERTRRIPTYIHKRKPSMRIIYWYWNRVNADSRPELAWDKNIEPWSFDKDDCVQYGMKQNIQYYQYPSDVKNEPIEYDLYFIGHDHNRAAQILQIQQEAEKTGANGQNRNHRSRCRKCSLYGSSKKNCPYKGDSGGNAKWAGRLHAASIRISLFQEEARNNKFGNPKRSIL